MTPLRGWNPNNRESRLPSRNAQRVRGHSFLTSSTHAVQHDLVFAALEKRAVDEDRDVVRAPGQLFAFPERSLRRNVDDLQTIAVEYRRGWRPQYEEKRFSL